MMKNRMLSAAMVVVIALGMVLAGCGKQAAADVDVTAVADALRNGLTFEDTELKEISDSILNNFYPTIDASQLENFKLYKSASGATAEEIAVFKAKDSDAVNTVEEAVKTRLVDLRSQFEDYIPAETKKIDDAITETHGNVVVLVVANDTAAAQKILDGLF